jgi:hypothetical protein
LAAEVWVEVACGDEESADVGDEFRGDGIVASAEGSLERNADPSGREGGRRLGVPQRILYLGGSSQQPDGEFAQ